MKRLFPLVLAFCAGCASIAPDDAQGPAAPGDPGPAKAAVEDANKAIVSGVSGHDIWLGKLKRGAQWSITELRNITTRPGYDNQPAFKANGTGIYYTSIRDGAQADIYLYESLINAAIRFTSTPQSEFSPRPMPAGDGVSVVRVEAGGEQSLWRYAGNRAFALLSNIDNLGYYVWLDAETVAMYRVTEPATLALATVPDGDIKTIPVAPGRSLHRVPGTRLLSFLDTSDPDERWISLYNRDTGAIQRIAPALEGSEDFAWTPDGQLLMAQGRKIYVWQEQWETAVDLHGSVPGEISRLQVSPDGTQIVFAATEGGV